MGSNVSIFENRKKVINHSTLSLSCPFKFARGKKYTRLLSIYTILYVHSHIYFDSDMKSPWLAEGCVYLEWWGGGGGGNF